MVSQVLNISLADILLNKDTIAVEARGWKRFYAGREEYGSWITTMFESDLMDEVVKGVAMRLTKS